MIQNEKRENMTILENDDDSVDIEMTLPDVLAYIKRLKNKKGRTVTNSVQICQQPNHQASRKNTCDIIAHKGDE